MFTRRGDSGETDVTVGRRTGKDSPVVSVEGDIDELLSFLGHAILTTKWDDIREDLMTAQEDVFTVGEDISAEGKRRTITPDRVQWLEERTLEYRKEIGKIKLFVIPGGSVESTTIHIARTVARRVERNVVTISREFGISKYVIMYLNRLSSMLFMQAIVSNKRQGIEERIWSIGRES